MKEDYNRKRRKARYIWVKNLMRKYPDCAYNGDFYCDHVYDPAYPWVWIDFRFFHSTKKRYYAACLTTAEYEAHNLIEVQAIDETVEKYKNLTKATIAFVDARYDELCVPMKITPKIELRNYGYTAIGLFGVVNKPYIDENAIREFIAFFKSLGEPTKPGLIWQGEEIEVDPRNLQARK